MLKEIQIDKELNYDYSSDLLLGKFTGFLTQPLSITLYAGIVWIMSIFTSPDKSPVALREKKSNNLSR